MTIFQGTAGDDSLPGTGGNDEFRLEDGGSDSAWGGHGDDVFYLGAAFDETDRIDGGIGGDRLVLDGDYSLGADLTHVTHIETVELVAGHSYSLHGLVTLDDAILTIDGSGLGVADSMAVDGEGRAHPLRVFGGAGGDVISGGDGADSLKGGPGADWIDGGDGRDVVYSGVGDNTVFGGGGKDRIVVDSGAQLVMAGDERDAIVVLRNLDAADHFDGGAGYDVLQLNGSMSEPVFLAAGAIHDIERLQVQGRGYDITLADGVVTGDQVLTITGGANAFRLDGSAESSGRLNVLGSAGNDVLIGGAGADQLSGGAGRDSLVGGHGQDFFLNVNDGDTLVGGAGADWFRFSDRVTADADLIQDLENKDKIDLSGLDGDSIQAGYQSFHLVASLSGHAGELALSYDSIAQLTRLEGDTDGDGQADLLIFIVGDHADFTHFVL